MRLVALARSRAVRIVLFVVLAATMLVPTSQGAVADAATVRRDPYGVPHITAATQESLAYAMGFTLAEDRPFQLDLYRRAGSGRLSEVLGRGSDDDYIAMDIVMRQEFFDEASLQAEVDSWDPDLRALWEAYGRGIDAGWAKVVADPSTHPIEFQASGYTPLAEPWSVVDSLAVTLLFTIVDNGAWGGDGEFENAALLQRLVDRHGPVVGREMFEEAIWMNDPDTSTVIGGEEDVPPPAILSGQPPSLGSEQEALMELDAPTEENRRTGDLLRRVARNLALPKFGSYALAIGPEHSATDGALFLGAPQSGISVPPVVWEVGLHAPGIECVGGAVPGAGPFIIMGRCEHHTFSIVAGVAGDTVDVVVEQLQDDGYLYDGHVEPFEEKVETFNIRSVDPTLPPDDNPVSTETEVHTFRRSRHGPVFADGDGVAYVRKRSQEGHIIDNLTSLFHLTTAQTLADADAAVEEASWSVHTVYADVDGHIAYWFSGRNPVHSELLDPRFPTPGHSSDFEWAGFIPKDENPQIVDPESGLVVANQGYDTKPVDWWLFSDDWRISRIERRSVTEDLVRARLADGITIAELEKINRLACCDIDPIVGFVADAARDAVQRHPDPTGRREQAIALLDAWEADGFIRQDGNADGRYDAPGVAIWGADDMPLDVYHGTLPPSPIWDRIFHLTFPDQFPAFAYYGYQDRLNPVDRALRDARGRPTGVPLGRDYFDNINTPGTETWHELVVQAIDEGLASLSSQFGTSDMTQWRHQTNTLEVRTLGALGMDPMKGFDHSSYNYVIDLGSTTEGGRSVLPPGQGSPVSAADYARFQVDGTYPEHFTDQVALYEAFGFKPMRLFGAQYQSLPVASVIPYAVEGSHPPHASDDEAETDEGQSLLIDVLANDYDPDGDPVTLSSVGNANHGVTAIESGKIRYTPLPRYNGDDAFTYTVSDGQGGTDTAVVRVSVASVFIPRSLTVSVAGSGSGSVTSDPSGIACPGTCSATYDDGTQVVLSANPGPQSTFAGWSGACTDATGDCVVTMSAARSVTATFTELAAHSLGVSILGTGSGRVASEPGGIDCPGDCTETYISGTEVTLTAEETPGSRFEGWGGSCTGAFECIVTMDDIRSVTATFGRPRLDVTVAGSGDGSVTSDPEGIDCPEDCSEGFDLDAEVVLTASPGIGSRFAGWTGACSGTSVSCTVVMADARSVTATFEKIRHDLTVTLAGTGTGSVISQPEGIECPDDCDETYDDATTVVLSASPAAHSTFEGWSGACTDASGDCVVEMSQARSVTATFDQIQHDLTVTLAGTGSGSVLSQPEGIDCPDDCEHAYDEPSTVVLSASPASRSTFEGWSGACTNQTGDCTVQMSVARSVTATFDRIPPQTLGVSITGTGTGRVTSDPAGIGCPGDCSEEFEKDTPVALDAQAGPGSRFTGWSGACTGTGACNVTMSQARSVTATFDRIGSAGLVFATNRWGSHELAIVNGGTRRLTRNDHVDIAPSVSPDGSKIAFMSGREGKYEIYLLNIDGTNLVRLTRNPAVDRDPTWTPDGSKIIFSTNRFGNYEIASMNVDGSGVTRLTDHAATDLQPAVSSDGSRIAFTSDREVNVMDADGSDVATVTEGSDPAWTADGTRLVLVTSRFGSNEIISVAVDGSSLTRLTTHRASDTSPAVSPDGATIAFVSNRGSNRDLYLMSFDGSNVRRITKHSKLDWGPSWIASP